MSFLSSLKQKAARSTIVESVHIFGQIGASQLAAAFGYYAFFSIFPFIALLLWVGSLFFQKDTVTKAIETYFPMGGEEAQMVWRGVEALQSAHGGVNAAFLLVFLWASSRFFQALVHGVNRAWHETDLPWWQVPLKNLVMVLTAASALIFGILALLLLQVARNVFKAMGDYLHEQFPAYDIGSYLHFADIARIVLASSVLFYAFSVLYMLAPRHRVPFRQVWLSALLVSVALQIVQVFFVNYLPLFLRYNAIYGTVGGVMFLMLWIYLSGALILWGSCYSAAAVRLKERWKDSPEAIPSS